MPGASRTKQILADSLKDLMRTIPLEKISVSDIVGHAEIGRNTFYYHFQDKFDLVNWIFQSESARFFAEHVSDNTWTTSLEGLEDYFSVNREFYCNALAYNGQNSLQDYLFDTVSDLIVRQIKELKDPVYKNVDEQELKFTGDFVASAIVGILSRWAAHGMKEDPIQYRECMRRICNGRMIRAYLDQDLMKQE